jgi:hypothetical protein
MSQNCPTWRLPIASTQEVPFTPGGKALTKGSADPEALTFCLQAECPCFSRWYDFARKYLILSGMMSPVTSKPAKLLESQSSRSFPDPKLLFELKNLGLESLQVDS